MKKLFMLRLMKLNIIEKIEGIQKDESDNWKKEKESLFDGCSNDWEVKINPSGATT